MALKEILEEDIDDERFDELFRALFLRRDTEEISSDFYSKELDNTYDHYPLLARLSDRVDELVVELREQDVSEERVIGIIDSRTIACVAIAAYAESEMSDTV